MARRRPSAVARATARATAPVKHASGLPTGVSKTISRKYQARITLRGKRIDLGTFDSSEEAAAAYSLAKDSCTTERPSPRRNGARRGTGSIFPSCPHDATPHNLPFAKVLRHISFLSACAGEKAMKKLQPKPTPMAMAFGTFISSPHFAQPQSLRIPLGSNIIPMAQAVPLALPGCVGGWQQPQHALTLRAPVVAHVVRAP